MPQDAAPAAVADLQLRLRPLGERFLEACLAGRKAGAEALLGMTVDADWYHEADIMTLRLDQLRRQPDYLPRSPRAIGLASSDAMIGHIGFHTPPDPAYLRPFVSQGIELGYTVFAPYRWQGYARAAILGLVAWAAETHGVRTFVVSIATTNPASTALALGLGFERLGEQEDEAGGVEVLYALRT